MREHVLFLDLVDDDAAIAAYEAHHAAGSVWPEVCASIRAAGIHEMRIYRFGTRLAMVMRVADDFDFAAKAAADRSNAAVMRWEALMDRFQQAPPGAEPGTKWQIGTAIFDLSGGDTLDEPR